MGLIYKPLSIGLAIALLASLLFGGWNYWRKNVYHTALTTVAADKAKLSRSVENMLTNELNKQATELQNRSDKREKDLKDQLAEIGKPPADRVVYKLRDRWLPVSCPAGAAPGAEVTQVGGLHPEDERALVSDAALADENTDERNTCVRLYEQARQSVIDFNK